MHSEPDISGHIHHELIIHSLSVSRGAKQRKTSSPGPLTVTNLDLET